MEHGIKKNLIYWFNIIFLIVNIAGAIYLFGVHASTGTENDQKIDSNEFLRAELGLTDEQFEQINTMEAENKLRYGIIIKLLEEQRSNLLEELSQLSPSPKKLNEIAYTVGKLHTVMKTQTITHLLNVKEICTPEQVVKLDELFARLLEIDSVRTNHIRIQKSKEIEAEQNELMNP